MNAASDDAFRMEQIGGAKHEWKFTDLTTKQEFFKDDDNQWDPSLKLFNAKFWLVSGSTDQNFIP